MKTAQYKYSKGDTVWRLKNRKIKESIVAGISIFIEDNQTVRYIFEDESLLDSEQEQYLYETKEELINSLSNES